MRNSRSWRENIKVGAKFSKWMRKTTPPGTGRKHYLRTKEKRQGPFYRSPAVSGSRGGQGLPHPQACSRGSWPRLATYLPQLSSTTTSTPTAHTLQSPVPIEHLHTSHWNIPALPYSRHLYTHHHLIQHSGFDSNSAPLALDSWGSPVGLHPPWHCTTTFFDLQLRAATFHHQATATFFSMRGKSSTSTRAEH